MGWNTIFRAYRYPVYADGKIVSFYTIIGSKSGNSAKQFGVEFANKLNSVLNSGAKEYFLVGYDNKVYVIANGNATLLAEYGIADIDLAAIKTRMDLTEDAEQKAQYQVFYETVLSKQATVGSSTKSTVVNKLTETDLENSVKNSNITFDVNRDQNYYLSLQRVTTKQNRAGSYRYFAVDTYNQLPDKNICWAVAASRIGNYWKDTNLEPSVLVNNIFQVSSHIGDVFDAKNALKNVYSLSSTFNQCSYTWKEVSDYIEGGYLLYGAFYDAAWTGGHAVCVNGYYINGSQGLLIMESLGGYYKQLLPNSSGKYEMNYTGLGNLTWEASLIV